MSWRDNLHYVGLGIALIGISVISYLGYIQVLHILDLIRSVPI